MAVVSAIGQTVTAQAREPKQHYAKHVRHCTNIIQEIQAHREKTQTLRIQMGLSAFRTSHSEKRSRSCLYLRWVHRLWKQRHTATWISWKNPPHYKQWMCIHHYEGSWTDPNSPFWGGLQMDYSFQQAYGSDLLRTKGTADHWTSLEQMWVAERAYKTRGFYPWPNTARYCGLI